MKTWSTPVRAEKCETVPCCCGSLSFKPALKCEGFEFVCCTACGLVQRNPQPVIEEVTARYIGTYGMDYLSYEIENEAQFFELQRLALRDAGFFRLEKTLLLRADHEQPSVLDAGCATGALLDFLRGRGWRVTGVEISPSAEYGRNIRKLDIMSLPLEENKFPNENFDVVIASHLIEHLSNPRSFLTEVSRVLKKNGHIFITTPNISGFQARLFGGRWRSAIFDHIYLFSVRTLKKLLKNTGFKVERCSTWGGIAAAIVPALIKKIVDFLAKRLNCGDVMIIRAKKTGVIQL